MRPQALTQPHGVDHYSDFAGDASSSGCSRRSQANPSKASSLPGDEEPPTLNSPAAAIRLQGAFATLSKARFSYHLWRARSVVIGAKMLRCSARPSGGDQDSRNGRSRFRSGQRKRGPWPAERRRPERQSETQMRTRPVGIRPSTYLVNARADSSHTSSMVMRSSNRAATDTETAA